MSGVKVTGFQIGDLTVNIEGSEDMTVKDVLNEAGIHLEGQSVVINGRRLADDEIASTPASEGDEVEVLTKSKGGC